MDDSTRNNDQNDKNNTSHNHGKSKPHVNQSSFGTDSFDADARESFGRNLRLFMSLTDGSSTPPESERPDMAMPSEAPAIARRLKQVG